MLCLVFALAGLLRARLDRGAGSTRSARRPEGPRTNGVEAARGRGRLRSPAGRSSTVGVRLWMASVVVVVTGSKGCQAFLRDERLGRSLSA